MKLSLTERMLAYGLTLFPLDEETQWVIYSFLETEEEKIQMIAYLIDHEEATEQDIMAALFEIVKSTTEK